MLAEMFRDLEYLIETKLAEMTIENLRKTWDYEKSLEENLSISTSMTILPLCQTFERWMESRCEIDVDEGDFE